MCSLVNQENFQKCFENELFFNNITIKFVILLMKVVFSAKKNKSENEFPDLFFQIFIKEIPKDELTSIVL